MHVVRGGGVEVGLEPRQAELVGVVAIRSGERRGDRRDHLEGRHHASAEAFVVVRLSEGPLHAPPRPLLPQRAQRRRAREPIERDVQRIAVVRTRREWRLPHGPLGHLGAQVEALGEPLGAGPRAAAPRPNGRRHPTGRRGERRRHGTAETGEEPTPIETVWRVRVTVVHHDHCATSATTTRRLSGPLPVSIRSPSTRPDRHPCATTRKPKPRERGHSAKLRPSSHPGWSQGSRSPAARSARRAHYPRGFLCDAPGGNLRGTAGLPGAGFVEISPGTTAAQGQSSDSIRRSVPGSRDLQLKRPGRGTQAVSSAALDSRVSMRPSKLLMKASTPSDSSVAETSSMSTPTSARPAHTASTSSMSASTVRATVP